MSSNTNLPSRQDEFINWVVDHGAAWTAPDVDPVKFGLTAADAAALKATGVLLRNAQTAAGNARQAAKNATLALNNAVRDARRQASDDINIIKTFAQTSDDPGVYALAGINAPSPRSEVPAPNAPFDLVAELTTDGSILLRWKARQVAGGVLYSVRRSIDSVNELILLDTVGEKEFLDETIPEGTRSITYSVQAKRGNKRSPQSGLLTVRFGREGGQTVIKSVKLAA